MSLNVPLSASEGKEVKPELLEAELKATRGANSDCAIFENTTVFVKVSGKPNVNPDPFKLSLCSDISTIFSVVMEKCDLQTLQDVKIDKISVTFSRNKLELRLRKGKPEDWQSFRACLMDGWEKGSHVNMLVHIEDLGKDRK